MDTRSLSLCRAPILGIACIAALAACSSKKAPPPPPPPEVGVVTLRPQAVTITTDLPGRTTAYRIAEVRPQVSGVILKRLFIEGSEVKAGQQLYQIDPAPFQASLESAQAALARAQATLVSAKLLAQRYQPLAAAHAVSQQDYDNAIAAQDQAAADVASAKAAVDTARINLVYTKVLSPISGHSGRSSVTEGALVDANQSAALVVVQQLDPIYVDVTQPSTLLLRLQRALASGQLKKVGDNQAQTQLTLEDGTPYEQPGKLQFSEVTVDAGTGSVTLRAVFPNPQKILLPGMFVREHLVEGVNEQGLLVPQQAVTHNPQGDATVLLVDADNTVSTRAIKTERAIGDQWLVSAGLAAGDKVVVVGLQRIKPEVKQVKPSEVSIEQLNAQPADAASGAPPAGGDPSKPQTSADPAGAQAAPANSQSSKK
ncbi:MAG: efflux system, rane fusion protein CmeA [Nevskia sp.]|nr:efflux system, rane fusion protein CmeA [Nevskia sp.]